MKEDISEDKFTLYYNNMLNSDYDTIIKTTKDNLIIEVLKGVRREDYGNK